MTLTDKQKIIIILTSVVLLTMLGFGMLLWQNKTPQAEIVVQGQNASLEPSPTPQKSTSFHIKGAVVNEGLYRLTGEVRLQDAINSAGGLKENADMKNVNLAMTISDGDEIFIPYMNETKTTALPKKTVTSNEESRQKTVPNKPSGETKKQSSKPININTATLDELDALKGIGPATAQKIIDYRETTPFKTIDDIKNVSGIGDKKFEDIKDSICVN